MKHLRHILSLGILIALVSSATAQSWLTNGLVAYYPFNGNANDASGNGNDGNATALVFSGDRFGESSKAGEFNGTSAYVEIPSLTTFQYLPLTYSVWIKTSDYLPPVSYINQVRIIMGRVQACDAACGVLSLFSEPRYGINDILGYYTGAEFLSSQIRPNLSSWMQLVLTIDINNRGAFYLNGNLVSSQQLVQLSTSFYPIRIGHGTPSVCSPLPDDFWKGGLDDVRIYNRALSSNEVAQLYVLESTLPTPQLQSDLTNVTAVVGGDAKFAVGASGSGPFTYQWFYTNSNPLAVAGGYPLSIAGFVYGVTITNGGFGYGSAPNVRFVGGSYALPASGFATVSNGSVSSITVTNPGLNYTVLPAVVIDPPSGLLVDQTNSTLTISNVGPSNLGSYWVVVSNGSGSVTSSVANITLLYPPSIAVPPVGQNLALRGATTLSVTAAGTPPFSYQWTLAGTNLPSATNSTLALTNFSLSQAGSYAVRVSSPYGTATSSSAQVSMLPSLNVPFAGGVNLWGQPATLTVGAVGTGPLVYQWYFNGQTIAGATSNSYTIPTIQFTNAGFYSVVVSSSLGSVTNTPYQVVVNPANVSLGLYPGITVSGTVGYTYTIQGTTDLSDTNAWVTLANLTLTQPVQIWSDYTADTTQSQNPRKFYRVVAGNVPAGMALTRAAIRSSRIFAC
jgi:Concanavalin A-like lectin/glucanases superfamily